MRRISLPFLAIMLIALTGMSQTTNQQNQKAVITSFQQLTVNRDAANVLVFRDQLAWGQNVLVPILQGLGANITTATSAQMASIDLAPFCLVVFESNQTEVFYASYTANLAKFTSYVNSGGVLEFHACVYSSTREIIGATLLPGGAATLATSSLEINNYIVDVAHPMVAGLSDPLNGSYASHDAFTSLPGNANVITRNSLDEPTTIEYSLGSGRVIATGMTWEFAYADSWNFGPMLPQCLEYSMAQCNPQEIPLHSWAIIAGVFLILTLTIFRYRKIF
jgi:hypothetical protein